MDKYFTGYCPVLGNEHRIRITYLNVSSLRSQSFVKDRFRCEHSIQKGCHISNCPIYEDAPDTL